MALWLQSKYSSSPMGTNLFFLSFLFWYHFYFILLYYTFAIMLPLFTLLCSVKSFMGNYPFHLTYVTLVPRVFLSLSFFLYDTLIRWGDSTVLLHLLLYLISINFYYSSVDIKISYENDAIKTNCNFIRSFTKWKCWCVSMFVCNGFF